MITKNRSNFIQTVSINNTLERDLNNIQWDKLVIQRTISYYTVVLSDLQRPDIIASKVYGNMQYFWPLMKFNLVDDIWNDLYIGQVLNCPSPLDIEQYFAVTKSYA